MRDCVDLASIAAAGSGAVWAHAGDDLNATLLSWPAGHVVDAHVNDEREVLMVGISGSAVVTVDGVATTLGTGGALVVPRGTRRSITAGPDGAAYLSTHRVRSGLQIRPRLAHPGR